MDRFIFLNIYEYSIQGEVLLRLTSPVCSAPQMEQNNPKELCPDSQPFTCNHIYCVFSISIYLTSLNKP